MSKFDERSASPQELKQIQLPLRRAKCSPRHKNRNCEDRNMFPSGFKRDASIFLSRMQVLRIE